MALPRMQYVLEETRTRIIRKFGIQGSEYRLRVEPLDGDIPQHLIVGAVYDLFDRKYIYVALVCLNFHSRIKRFSFSV